MTSTGRAWITLKSEHWWSTRGGHNAWEWNTMKKNTKESFHICNTGDTDSLPNTCMFSIWNSGNMYTILTKFLVQAAGKLDMV
jgi:hypothetical protein